MFAVVDVDKQTFSVNGDHVIKPLNYERRDDVVGDQPEIGFYDAFTVNKLYRCAGRYNFLNRQLSVKPTFCDANVS